MVKMVLGSSDSQASSVASLADNYTSGFSSIISAIENLANADGLEGEAYTNVKTYGSTVVTPLAKGFILLADAAKTDTQLLPDRYRSDVGSEDLDEDTLTAQISAYQSTIDANNTTLGKMEADDPNKSSVQSAVNDDTAEKGKLEEKLRKLREYDAASSGFFDDIADLETNINTGLSQLQTDVAAFNGSFTIPSKKALNWTKAINTKWEKRTLVMDYVNTYGFDRATAETLYKLQEGILEKADKENWSNKKVLYEYNRLIASFAPDSYVSTRWKAICGTEEKEERDKLCKEYGLSSGDIETLEKGIVTQHTDSEVSKDFAHEAVQIAAFTEESWDFISTDNAVHNLSHIVNEGLEHEEISFKGDVDSGRYSDSDFNSDLDAINYYKRATADKADRDDIFTIGADYNSGISDNSINRVNEFYDNYDYSGIIFGWGKKSGEDVVEDIIEDETIGSNHISSPYSDDEKEKHKKDFYDYLERGEKKNVK
ncbi:hypothetical protein DDV21_010060 [Streptococcus chenjunshii]|uniref:LXG domain-containing protein n=1 Tax=Streptococcus chenjunshii TaxID=2173853 RepID=A0A346NEF0_9STRE|nr:T7SS effector LXG polymorphic toxin [Streptococcus chenjunshii]AXQ79395.1 hypothetical protein DDV21_010060 [Streptococcus chenjunshii]